MTDDRKANMLERVRALLAKADSTNFPAEADTFRAKADELMTLYAIEQWQVDLAQEGATAKPKPEARDIDCKWFYRNSRGEELWQMFHAVAAHCRCRVVWWKGTYTTPVIGLPSDLDWFDMLFTHLMLQMGKGLEPHPSPELPMIENLVRMKEAGMKWERIGELLIQIGQLDAYNRNVGVRFTKLYTEYCAEHGRQRKYIAPSVFQRSYAQGFLAEVRTRLRSQRNEQSEATTGLELIIRDITAEVNSMAHDMFGEPPESKSVDKNLAFDFDAYGVGREAGAKASITAHPSERVGGGGRKELDA